LFVQKTNNKAINIFQNKNSSFSVKQILASSWEDYVLTHEVEDYQLKEVERSLNCYGYNNGCFVFYCKHCDKYIFQSYGCNSRLCSCCGKRYADQWSANLARSMFPVPHRHIVFSIPPVLWDFLRDKSYWKDYMDCSITCFNNYLPRMLKKMNGQKPPYNRDIGLICVFHPFGKDMKFHPHLHLLITEGGFDSNGKFHKIDHFPAEAFRRCWQYVVLEKFQRLGLSHHIASALYKDYPNGFYVWVHKRGRIKKPKLVARYVGRYVRHPAIANRRITYFDCRIVKFYYDDEGEIVEVVKTVDDFITSLIQHVPPPQFRMVRYYGAYSRKKKKYLKVKLQSAIKQLTLYKFGLIKPILCPICHKEMEYVWYCKKPPPEEPKTQRELIDYITQNYTRIGKIKD
jgi:hypothetical protein